MRDGAAASRAINLGLCERKIVSQDQRQRREKTNRTEQCGLAE
jgi:hypothetical protein